MKLFRLFFLAFLLNFSFAFASEDWGNTGHRTTGEIAEQHLTKKTKRAIDKILHGYSLAYVSTYADEIKSDNKYDKYYTWHYVNFPFDTSYEAHPKSEKGDLVIGIQKCINVLKDDTVSREDKEFYLKMLVHFVGDLHQPLHVGKAEDRGGNDFKVQWFYKDTNLHSVWDSKMIDGYNMSYTELANNSRKLSKEQIKAIQNGTVLDWVQESRNLCLEIYESAEPEENLRYRYSYNYMDTLRMQLQKGGIRLASILNEIFG